MPKKKRSKKKPQGKGESELEREFLQQWASAFPTHIPAREYRFHPTRKFRFDFAWPIRKLAVEVHGYGPGHFSLPGMTQDFDKHMEAIKLNWTIVYLTSTHLSQKRIDEVLDSIGELLGLSRSSAYVPLSRRSKYERP